MRLAWFSPLPPMPSGISDYSFDLLKVLRTRASVDAFCPTPRQFSRPQSPPGVPVRPPAALSDGAVRYDAVFYHLGNNPFHQFVYEAAIERPGILVLHDVVVHHLIAYLMFESRRDPAGYAGLMRAEYGGVGWRLSELGSRGAATELQKFWFPLNRHVAKPARAIVVHSEFGRERIAEVAPEAEITVIPHHSGIAPQSVASITRESARRQLRLPSDAFLVGHFGFITPAKQPAAVLGGFSRLAAIDPDALLLMVGADTTGGGLDTLTEKLGIKTRVRPSGFVDLRRFYLYLKAVDAVVTLRYPSAGESSGTIARALGEGRAVITNNSSSFAEIPADLALKVEIDGDQPRQVGDHLVRLFEDNEFRTGIERRAKHFATTVLDPARCTDLYLAVAKDVAGRVA